MKAPVFSVLLRSEHDVVTARQRARDIAAMLGFDHQDQVRIATAVSEIARNAVNYGRSGNVEFFTDSEAAPATLCICISDKGPGIADLSSILEGTYQSKTGLGQGVLGARRLMDEFDIESSPRGTSVRLGKHLPRRVTPPNAQQVTQIAAELGRQAPRDVFEEVRRENQELLRALEELRQRQEELDQLNNELEETNRGVVALYAELDERAEQLRRADQTKSRFLSHMSHEFRTPLNSILALSRLLLDQVDGRLEPEQEKQVGFIRQSAESLLEMVNDLLDLAKVEAGKSDVRLGEVQAANLFGTLRGLMRPLLTNENVALVFEEPAGIPAIVTDEAKLAQILRNFVSNALKFTERGEVRVRARLEPAGDRVTFSVSDTGIGIAPEHRERIFREFEQLSGPLQSKVKGTGLGLPLTRKLAELLHGSVSLESKPGEGSTFSVTLPLVCGSGADSAGAELPRKVLIIDDEEISRYLIRQAFGLSEAAVMEAPDGVEGVSKARKELPQAIFLDLRMPELNGFEVLRQLKANPATRRIPVVIITSKTLSAGERAALEQAGALAVLSKEILTSSDGIRQCRAVLERAGLRASGPGSMVVSK